MWNKLKKYIYLQEFGWFEFLFVLWPIVSSYQYSGAPMHLLWLLMLDLIALRKRSFHINPMLKYYKWLFIFVTFHNILWLFVMNNVTSFFINSWIGQIIILSSLFIVLPALNFSKIRGPLNLLVLICIAGLLYHVVMVLRGQIVKQIPLPFLPTPENSRLLFEGVRPKGFFPEPQAYCAYMLIPLYLLLMGKRYLLAGIIIISMFLSTSTTGLFTSFLMLGFYTITQKIGMRWKVAMCILAIGLFYILNNSDLFVETINKATSETNGQERTGVGFLILEQLCISDILFGIPYASIGEMIDAGRLNASELMIIGDGRNSVVFIPTFWYMLFIYGIFGLMLYLSVYYDIFKKCRQLWPLLLVIGITLFSNPDSLGSTYVYQLCFMYILIDFYKKNQTI